jgi:tripartite-type tricarboxylate transporter receptor subunit TctC
MTKVLRRTILAVALACCAGTAAIAQDFPHKGVRIISPYPPGSGPDQMMRVIVEQLSSDWKQPVVLDARPGGNGVPVMEAIKAAPPDGYTIGVASDGQLTINPLLYRSLPYDPLIDFAPITLLFSSPFYVTVAAKGAYRTLPDLIADARSVPNKVSYGALLIGSPAQLGSALFASLIDAQMVFVPYRDPQQMLLNVANGNLGWTLSTAATVAAMVDGGLIRLLAIAQRARSPHFPDIPTVAEAGGPELDVKSWVSLIAPRDTPPDVVARLNKGFVGVLAAPAIQERLRIFGFTSEAGPPDELTRTIRDDMTRNSELIKRAGASAK